MVGIGIGRKQVTPLLSLRNKTHKFYSVIYNIYEEEAEDEEEEEKRVQCNIFTLKYTDVSWKRIFFLLSKGWRAEGLHNIFFVYILKPFNYTIFIAEKYNKYHANDSNRNIIYKIPRKKFTRYCKTCF